MKSNMPINAPCDSDFELVACDFCGSRQHEAVLTTTAFDLTGPFTAVRCTQCGLIFTNPRPTPGNIGRYYGASSYYAYQQIKSVRDLKFRDRVKYGLYNAYYNPRKQRIRALVASVLLSRVLAVPPRGKMGRLLDVGCGSGGFLLMMRLCGWETAGVELSAEASAVANRHGLNVHCGQLEDAPFPENSFDVIVLSQTLEHLYSPKSTLNTVHHLLKSDGILIIGVPNYDSFDRRLFHESWHAWELPRHLYHFTPDILRRYCEDTGFQILSMRSKMLTLPRVTLGEIRRKGKNYSNHIMKKYAFAAGYLFKVWLIKPTWMLISKYARANFGVHFAIYAVKK